MHEFVATARPLKEETGVRAMDVAKRVIDLGYHPPTVYFPLVVEEALMVEPTETETKETLDALRRCPPQACRGGLCGSRPAARSTGHDPSPSTRRGSGRAASQAPLVNGRRRHYH